MKEISKKISKPDLLFVIDRITHGLGNCFFNAIRLQSACEELKLAIYSSCIPAQLHGRICNFVVTSDLEHSKKELHFMSENKAARGFAVGLVVEVTEIMLIRKIVLSKCNIEKIPYLLLNGGRNVSNFSPLLFGNPAGCYYQFYLVSEGSCFTLENVSDCNDGNKKIKNFYQGNQKKNL